VVKRSVVFTLLAVVVLSAAAWSAGEELTYSGPFVSVNSPLRLCATATDDNGPVAGLGLWFQAWDMAGSARTNGPFGTVQTNVLGEACNMFNLLPGLHEVQAFGTGDFDGVSSIPVVVSNHRSSPAIPYTALTWSAAGIATFGGSPMTSPREAAFGLYMGSIYAGQVGVSATGSGIQMVAQSVGSSPGGLLRQFLWLDPFNPDGPTRVEATWFRNWLFVAGVLSGEKYGRFRIVKLDTPCYIQVGDTSIQGILHFTLDTGIKPLAAPFRPSLVLRVNSGTFSMRVTRPNGQVIYDVGGSFEGTGCTQFFGF